MVRAVAVGILCEVLLVIVVAEAGFATQSTLLWRLWRSSGRLPVDVASNPAVDRRLTQSRQKSTVSRAEALLEGDNLATVLVADLNLYCIATSLFVWFDTNTQVLCTERQ